MVEISGRPSTGPKDKLLDKWETNYNDICDAIPENIEYNKFDWDENEGTNQEKAAADVRDWCEEMKLESEFSRGDYMTALNLVIMLLGVWVPNFSIPRPGAVCSNLTDKFTKCFISGIQSKISSGCYLLHLNLPAPEPARGASSFHGC